MYITASAKAYCTITKVNHSKNVAKAKLRFLSIELFMSYHSKLRSNLKHLGVKVSTQFVPFVKMSIFYSTKM